MGAAAVAAGCLEDCVKPELARPSGWRYYLAAGMADVNLAVPEENTTDDYYGIAIRR